MRVAQAMSAKAMTPEQAMADVMGAAHVIGLASGRLPHSGAFERCSFVTCYEPPRAGGLCVARLVAAFSARLIARSVLVAWGVEAVRAAQTMIRSRTVRRRAPPNPRCATKR
jgi:hypothetical protein